jgi:hypothetical protein
MSAGRNKNSRSRTRKMQRFKAALKREARRQYLKKLRRARRERQKLLRNK